MKTAVNTPTISRLIAAASAMMLLTSGIALAQVIHQDINVTIDGQPVQFEDIGPQQINGRTMVPVRGVLEKLGATIAYNNQTQTVTASTPTIDIQLKIGSKTAIVNANPVILDVPAQSIQNHTFVPLRFLGEALGADLKWNAATRTVVITTRGAAANGAISRSDESNVGRVPGTVSPPAVDNGRAPVIDSFTQNSGKWLRAGETMEAQLDGTPGGQASFRIPGLVDDVPMRETTPGHYVGAWRVPADKPMQLKSAAVIASLKVGNRTAPLIQAGDTVSVDAIPPRTTDLAPEDNSNVTDPQPNISAVFGDQGSGVDPASVRLLLNGNDVTDQATVARRFITYKPPTPLPPGMQEVELRVADMAGNRRTARWVFREQPRAAGGIKTVTDNADHVLQPGETLHVEMTGTPGGRATFTSGTAQNVPLREVQPGRYVAEYTIRRGDDLADKPIAFHLVTPDGQKFEQASRAVVRVASGKPLPPTITSPDSNAAPSNPMVVRGRTTPNGRVQVRVSYRNKVLGVIALQGTAADTIVTADKNGLWETEPINLGGILGNRGVEYTITATALNAADEQSDPTTMKFRAQ
jgi:hypothetical protein